MNILLTGATGFIGHALAEALLSAGHHLICVVRDPARWGLRERWPATRLSIVVMDVGQATDLADWRPVLVGVDVVVNGAGIFQESASASFEALHTRAPIALFDAAAQAGVRCLVQISALGADANAQSPFHLSKRTADDHLRTLDLPAWVVQPSLVYGLGGTSAEFFNRLASLPVLVLPRLGAARVQPVLLDDVVQGVVSAIDKPPADCQTVAFVGPQAISLPDYLARLRRALGWRRSAHLMEVPLAWMQVLAKAGGRLWRGRLLSADALAMLARGNSADPHAFAQLLGRLPVPVEAFVPTEMANPLRQAAVLTLWQPLLRWSIALVWLWTGLVSLGLYPTQDSLVLLDRVGAQGMIAWGLLYGAALLDLALGLATLALPSRWRRPLWAVQVFLIVGYTALISWRLPEFWLHPYGPVLKNLPLLAAIGLLWSLEPPGASKSHPASAAHLPSP